MALTVLFRCFVTTPRESITSLSHAITLSGARDASLGIGLRATRRSSLMHYCVLHSDARMRIEAFGT